MNALNLIIGSPETTSGGATFSRFVLPFRYRLASWSGEVNTPYYTTAGVPEPLATGDRTFQRLHYLTIETADVLFRRARWFELSSPEGVSCPVSLEFEAELISRRFRVTMRKPRLVLFEFSEDRQEKPEAEGVRGNAPGELLATGFLLVELFFPQQEGDPAPTIDDLLRLNELFRYCRMPFEGHATGYRSVLGALPLQYSVALSSQSSEGTVGAGDPTSNGIYHDRWANLLAYPLRDADGRILRLFPEEWLGKAAESQEKPLRHLGEDSRGWVIHADNRAFVWTCVVIPDGTFALQSQFGAPLVPHGYGHWVKLLNVDPPANSPSKTHETSAFEQKWADERTYHRWEHVGTTYGFTTHSGALMVGQGHYATNFADMYFDQTLLLLFLRATTFRFSESLSRLSADMRSRQGPLPEELRERFDSLRREFALFTNLYQFPLVSNQQQGLELYTLARQSLDVDELFREVQQEIESTHSYIELRDTQRQTRTTTILSVVGGVGLALGLAMAFLGMNVIIPDFKRTGERCDDWACVAWWALENVGLFAAVTVLAGVLVWFGVKLTRALLGYQPLAWRTLSESWANRRRG